jgi:hypothetical protein
MTLIAGVYDIICPQGATFDSTFTYKIGGTAVNLTGFTAAMQVRTAYPASPFISLTTGSGITLGGSAGTIRVVISATSTASYKAGQFLYDLELTSASGVVTRLIQGKFTITSEVTRA